MTLRAAPFLLLLLAVAAGLAPARAAAAPAAPKVTAVSPMDAVVGDTLLLRGSGFRVGRGANRVLFKRDGARSVVVKAARATRTRLWVTVPAELAPLLARGAGAPRATRFRLRVLAERLGRAYTAPSRSPRIGPPPAPPPGDCDADGARDEADLDDDGDLLDDALERELGTEPCSADTDGDGAEDGWEYRSATDLNQLSCPAAEDPVPCAAALPHPRKTPYPNPRVADAHVDFDGDSLTSGEEHAAWRRHGRGLGELWYSDGRQASVDADPADGCRGLTPPAPPAPGYSLDLDGDGCLTDDERDEDGDLLTNYDETHGRLSGPGWGVAAYEEPAYPIEYRGTDWLDADSDGDGLRDGLDDQDADDFLNLEELERGPAHPAAGGLWVHPFNPCLPSLRARTCDRHPPFKAQHPPFSETPKATWPLWIGPVPPTHLIVPPA